VEPVALVQGERLGHAGRWYRPAELGADGVEADPGVKLRLNARNARAVKERAGTLLSVIRNAAIVDADIDELLKRISTDFHANQQTIVASLAALGALRPGLEVAQAADILWALNHPDVWHLLVEERGWTPEAWERWFSQTSCRELLPDP
jgi:hypothetical protein